jgi:hypothetical protein
MLSETGIKQRDKILSVILFGEETEAICSTAKSGLS